MTSAATRSKGEHGPLLYVGIWVCLVVLTTATYLAGQVELGAWQLPIGLIIAFIKATLVVLFFMHLLQHSGGSRLTLVIALVFVALLISLVIADFGLRFNPTRPPGPIPFDVSPGGPNMQYTSPSDLGPGSGRQQQ